MILRYRAFIKTFSILTLFSLHPLGQHLWSQNYEKQSNQKSSKYTTPQSAFEDTELLALWNEEVVIQLASSVVHTDNVFFKGYLLNQASNAESNSSVLHVELLDAEKGTIKKEYFKILEGQVNGTLTLPEKIKPGTYYIKAYTRWMLNYGDRHYTEVPFIIADSNTEEYSLNKLSTVYYVSEGGKLFFNHTNKLVIHLPTSPSKFTNVQIVDDLGEQVATVQPYNGEYGLALFNPAPERSYQLQVEDQSIPIDNISKDGFSLQVNNIDEEITSIQITAVGNVETENIKLVGEKNGVVLFEKKLDLSDQPIFELDISKNKLPFGLLALKVVNAQYNELASRWIHIDREPLSIAIENVSENESEVTYKIAVTDEKDKPVQTTLAISAIRNYRTERPSRKRTFHFTQENQTTNGFSTRVKRYLNDLELILSTDNPAQQILTKTEPQIKFPVQKGLELSGYAYTLDEDLLYNTNIQIIATSAHDTWVGEITTDDTGFLLLEGLQLTGETTLIFRTEGSDTQNRLVQLRPSSRKKATDGKTFESFSENVEKRVEEKYMSSNVLDSIGATALNEVKVSGKKATFTKGRPSNYGASPFLKSRTKYQNTERPRTIRQLLREMPRVQVVDNVNGLFASVSISGMWGSPLFVVDGLPLPQSDGGSLNNVEGLVSATDVERIELLADIDAAIYGSRGAGGVIAIYTRSGGGLANWRRKEAQLTLKGYEVPLDFETYFDELTKKEKRITHLRYWNPSLRTNEDGEAMLILPKQKDETPLSIEATAVTPDGKIGWNLKRF